MDKHANIGNNSQMAQHHENIQKPIERRRIDVEPWRHRWYERPWWRVSQNRGYSYNPYYLEPSTLVVEQARPVLVQTPVDYSFFWLIFFSISILILFLVITYKYD